MNILLVNDDNIHAKGIRLLAEALSKNHSITVVAPKHEMSGVSHACTIYSPLFAEEINYGNEISAYAVEGTPSDCVKIAIRKLCKVLPELVISGINCGDNSGISAFYSGTVAGAREGTLFGIRSIALSVSNFSDTMYSYVTTWIENFIGLMESGGFSFDGKVTMLNVNFPSCPPENIRGTKITGQGITPFNDYYEERISPSGRKYFWLYGEKPVLQKKNDDDTILAEKFVTIAPLILDMTDNTLVNKYCAENNGILNL